MGKNRKINLLNVFSTFLLLFGVVLFASACGSKEEKGYSISYIANNGTEEKKSYEFSKMDFVSVSANMFTKDSAIFKEWNSKNDGTGDTYTPGVYINVTESIEMYAIWSTLESYDVNCLVSGSSYGSVSGVGKYEKGQTAVLNATAKSDGTFRGWYENNALISTAEQYIFVVSGAKTIEARFEKTNNKFKVNIL